MDHNDGFLFAIKTGSFQTVDVSLQTEFGRFIASVQAEEGA